MQRVLLSGVLFFLGAAAAQAEPVIIKCARLCTAVAQAIESRRGGVTFPPTGPVNFGGATLNSPEIASIANPVAGEWTAIVAGFTAPATGGDRFSLRIAVDGNVMK